MDGETISGSGAEGAGGFSRGPTESSTPDRVIFEEGFGADAESEDDGLRRKEQQEKHRDQLHRRLRSLANADINTAASGDGNHDQGSRQHYTYPPQPAASSSEHPRWRRWSREHPSEDDTGLLLATTKAVKVIKTAVLHDARNIKGKDGLDEGKSVLGFKINSAHEAKVLFSAPRVILPFLNLYFIHRNLLGTSIKRSSRTGSGPI